MTWRPANSLVTLRDQVNERWPDRSTISDGFIGNAAHQAEPSDHNPNAQGVVCAFDLTAQGVPIDELLEAIRESQDSRVKYVIYNRRIFRSYDKPGIAAWTWAAYTKDPHTSHAHFSVGHGPDGQSTGNYDDPSPWALTPLVGPVPVPKQEEDDMPPAPATVQLPDGNVVSVFRGADAKTFFYSSVVGNASPIPGTWASGPSLIVTAQRELIVRGVVADGSLLETRLDYEKPGAAWTQPQPIVGKAG